MRRNCLKMALIFTLAMLMLVLSACDGYMIVPITSTKTVESGEPDRTPGTDEDSTGVPTDGSTKQEEPTAQTPTKESSSSNETVPEAPTKEPEAPTAAPEAPTREPEIPTIAPEEPTKEPDSSESEDTTEIPEIPVAPSYNFQGMELGFLSVNTAFTEKELYAEPEEDRVSTAIFRRNMEVEERLNVSLVFSYTEQNAFNQNVSNLYLAESHDFDVIAGMPRNNSVLAASGCLADLKQEGLSALDPESDAWYQQFNETAAVYGGLYMTVGAINYSATLAAQLVVFNSDLAEGMCFENFYALYEEGKWTMDAMTEFIKMSYLDLDGDPGTTAGDLFGLAVSDAVLLNTAVSGLGLSSVLSRDGNSAYIIKANESVFAAYESLAEWRTIQGIYRANDFVESFQSGRALFTIMNYDQMIHSKSDEFTYGVLPFPKADMEQIDYYVSPVTTHTVISVMAYESGYDKHYECAAVTLNLMNSISVDAFSSVRMAYATSREMDAVLERIPEMLAWDGSVLITSPLANLFRTAFVQDQSLAVQINAQKEAIKSQFANYFYSFL